MDITINEAISANALDGKRLYYSFLAGAQRLFDNQVMINKINVFPVKDGDTGTNLASTFRSIVDTNIPTTDIKVTADALAEAALIGARGNSGIIFAQFLYGFSNEIDGKEKELDIQSFSKAITCAVRYAYEAIANPVEGTMITVIREWAEFIDKMKDGFDDFVKLIEQSYDAAAKSLAETPEKLAVLKKANVVDAGGKAFVLFLEGMIEFFKHGELKQLAAGRNVTKVAPIEMDDDHEDITFRYCTEGMVNMNDDVVNGKKFIRDLLDGYGDSVVVAGSEKRIRFHVHTDNPSDVFVEINKKGVVTFQKVDDMVMQKDISTNKKSSIALVTDSTCDLPTEIIEKYQIHVVPLSVHFGDQYYLDGVTIEPNQFYKLLDSSKVYPSTAQPTYKDFTNKFEYLATHYDKVLVLAMTSGMSGTWSNANKAATSVNSRVGNKIKVIDTKHIAASLGMINIRAAQELEQGTGFEDLAEKVEQWRKNTTIWVTSRSVKAMVRSGRLSAGKAFLTQLLDIKPVIRVNEEGSADLFAKPRNLKKGMQKVFADIEQKAKGRKVWGYAITQADNMDTANWFADRMRELCGKEPIFISLATPVLTTNTGIGTVALGVMFED